jgi:hypothetical protein
MRFKGMSEQQEQDCSECPFSDCECGKVESQFICDGSLDVSYINANITEDERFWENIEENN